MQRDMDFCKHAQTMTKPFFEQNYYEKLVLLDFKGT